MTKIEAAYIATTLEIMKRPLSDDSQEMDVQIREAEGRVGYCYFLLASADEALDKQSDAAAEVLRPQELKAYQLETKVKAMCSGYRRERDEIAGLVKSLEGRTMTGLGILKYRKGLPQE